MSDINNLFVRIWAFIDKALSGSKVEAKLEVKAKSKTAYKPCATKRKIIKKK